MVSCMEHNYTQSLCCPTWVCARSSGGDDRRAKKKRVLPLRLIQDTFWSAPNSNGYTFQLCVLSNSCNSFCKEAQMVAFTSPFWPLIFTIDASQTCSQEAWLLLQRYWAGMRRNEHGFRQELRPPTFTPPHLQSLLSSKTPERERVLQLK